ncbi:hypothetical protein GCM10027454_05230 [Algoriphagus aestuariicola]|jgi:hypothetical protein
MLPPELDLLGELKVDELLDLLGVTDLLYDGLVPLLYDGDVDLVLYDGELLLLYEGILPLL